MITDQHLDADRLGAGLDHVDGLRVAIARDEEGLATLGQGRCFKCGGGPQDRRKGGVVVFAAHRDGHGVRMGPQWSWRGRWH